jgi:hypothetical protein
MDYANFIAKGRIVSVTETSMTLYINESRTVKLTGYKLKQYKVGHYAYADGFLEGDKAYILYIKTFERELKGQYEKYRQSEQDTVLSNAGIQKRKQDIQEERVYPIYTRSKKST